MDKYIKTERVIENQERYLPGHGIVVVPIRVDRQREVFLHRTAGNADLPSAEIDQQIADTLAEIAALDERREELRSLLAEQETDELMTEASQIGEKITIRQAKLEGYQLDLSEAKLREADEQYTDLLTALVHDCTAAVKAISAWRVAEAKAKRLYSDAGDFINRMTDAEQSLIHEGVPRSVIEARKAAVGLKGVLDTFHATVKNSKTPVIPESAQNLNLQMRKAHNAEAIRRGEDPSAGEDDD